MGNMKIALAQQNYTVGDFEGNKAKIISAINKAKALKTELLILPEQAICGSPAYDLLGKITFLDQCEEELIEIASHCDNISVIIGLPIPHNNKTISVAALIQNRRIVRYIGKENVIARDEMRHISPSKGSECVKIGESMIAIVVGQDIYNEQEYGEYADTIINIANSPYMRGRIESRFEYFKKLSFATCKNIAFVNCVGGQTDTVYDGSSFVVNRSGDPIVFLKNFEEDFGVVELDGNAPIVEMPENNKIANIYRGLKLGLKDYFTKNGFTTACIGLSGGVDCAVVAALAAEVLGGENIHGLMMPSMFSSQHSIDDAVKLAENLGMSYDIVPITQSYKAVLETLSPVFGETRFDVTEENIQARLRMVLLMALSNKKGHIMLNTSNKSERAVGYGTLYGDSVGAISVIGDIYKSEVFDLARYINREGEVIPKNSILKPPSAELRPEQKDSDSLPAYDILDTILYRMIEKGEHREEIINAGFDAETVYKVHRLLVRNEYKRFQSCPAIRMSIRPFGVGYTMPLTSKYGKY